MPERIQQERSQHRQPNTSVEGDTEPLQKTEVDPASAEVLRSAEAMVERITAVLALNDLQKV